MDMAVLVDTWWYWVSRGRYLLVLGGTGSVEGGNCWYMSKLDSSLENAAIQNVAAVHCIKSSFQWNDELDCVNWFTTRWALLGKNLQQQLTDAPRVSRDRVLRYPWCSRGRRHGMVWFSVGVTMPPTPDLTAPTTIAAGLFAMVRHHTGRKR